jgi:phenylacetic acid degradation operon negative regulatory protein
VTASPSLNRRHAAGGASARSLLLTVLGEFVLPARRPALTRAIVHVLGLLGVEEKAARQALARTASDGWLRSERVGRAVRWSLTAPGRRLLTDGARRIYSFGTPSERDGGWLVLFVSVPEARRAVRHRLRTRLSWAGFGSPAPGVWVCPHPEREVEAAAALADLGLAGETMSFVARFGGVGDETAMVTRAWDLAEIGARYDAFVAEFDGLEPGPGDGVLLAQARLVHEWRRFVFVDPVLPRRLLPERWSGDRAARLFHDRHEAWRDAAAARWSRLAGLD